MPITPDSVLLTGRRGVVTGAAQGIGAAIAITLARFGADVAICDRDADGLARTAAEVAAAGRHAHAELLDVRDADAVRDWIAPLDRVDVLVNNAGGGFEAAFLDVNDKGQDALIRENFASVTNCIRACVPKMPGDGRVDRQHHVDRGAPRRARLRGLQRDEGRAREPHQDARARARRPAHPGQLHRARRHPDAGHRWRRCR